MFRLFSFVKWTPDFGPRVKLWFSGSDQLQGDQYHEARAVLNFFQHLCGTSGRFCSTSAVTNSSDQLAPSEEN